MAQPPISLSDQTIKLGGLGEESFYFGFQQGDQVQIDFEELRNKGIKEIEIKDYHSGRSLYSDYEIKHIRGKQITIPTTGVYQFRFYNAALGKRIGQIKISRVAVAGYEKFNSTVYWRTDYDTSYSEQNERYLERIDTTIVNVTEKIVKVNSQTNQNGNRQYIYFSLPSNTISWSYYIGVGQESQDVLEQATKELAKKATPLISNLTSYGPLAALALGGVSYLTQLQKGEDVKYYLLNGKNFDLLRSGLSFSALNKGKIINDFTSFSFSSYELLYFYFINDNAITGITVKVKVVAIRARKIWNSRTIQVPHITSRKVAYLKENK